MSTSTPDDLHVRPEEPSDFETIRTLVSQAHGRVDEAERVERVRDSGHYVRELALVAETDSGELVGHVLFSYVELKGDRSLAVLALDPLSVRPDHRREGTGSALVEAGLGAAERRGEPLVLVTGPPRYYTRFSFEPARPRGIEPPPPGVPDDIFMVKLLPAYAGQKGQVSYPPALAGA